MIKCLFCKEFNIPFDQEIIYRLECKEIDTCFFICYDCIGKNFKRSLMNELLNIELNQALKDQRDQWIDLK